MGNYLLVLTVKILKHSGGAQDTFKRDEEEGKVK